MQIGKQPLNSQIGKQHHFSACLLCFEQLGVLLICKARKTNEKRVINCVLERIKLCVVENMVEFFLRAYLETLVF